MVVHADRIPDHQHARQLRVVNRDGVNLRDELHPLDDDPATFEPAVDRRTPVPAADLIGGHLLLDEDALVAVPHLHPHRSAVDLEGAGLWRIARVRREPGHHLVRIQHPFGFFEVGQHDCYPHGERPSRRKRLGVGRPDSVEVDNYRPLDAAEILPLFRTDKGRLVGPNRREPRGLLTGFRVEGGRFQDLHVPGRGFHAHDPNGDIFQRRRLIGPGVHRGTANHSDYSREQYTCASHLRPLCSATTSHQSTPPAPRE